MDDDNAASDADAEAAVGTQGDWLRRGGLCERLHRVADAERAYRVAVHLGWSVVAWRALSRIYAAWAWPAETLTALSHLAEAAEVALLPSLTQPLACLISACGLQAVREAQAALGEPHALLNEAFHEAVRWRWNGFDR